jgi:AmiR/NasT family two-component response regulator
MRGIEDTLARDLAVLCATKLAEARSQPAGGTAADREWLITPLSVAMLVADVESGMPKPMRSILAVIGEQTRRIELMSTELESARSALAERKLIEQAKGLLMRSHKLSEQDAYTLLRQTAMNRNKRIFEVAAALVNMAELLPP